MSPYLYELMFKLQYLGVCIFKFILWSDNCQFGKLKILAYLSQVTKFLNLGDPCSPIIM